MIALHGKGSRVSITRPLERSVWLLVGAETLTGQREGRAYLVKAGEDPPQGFGLYVSRTGRDTGLSYGNYVQLPPQLDYLTPGDVLSVSPDCSRLRVVWRHASEQNSVLVTERCDNFCLMCSQPPRRVADDWLLDETVELIRLLPLNTRNIGFTGGEPTIWGERLLEPLKLCRTLLPHTAVHLLSNGRRFADTDFALAYAAVDNPNMMVGIPLHGPEPSLHDYVAQVAGAFEETIAGILNLARLRQRIELRIVVHKQTAPVVVEIAEFIARNLPFVEQVALMGLEPIGFAKANLAEIWIDPFDYREALSEAAILLERQHVRTVIYNHQLCLLEPRIWHLAVKSISDWKSEYLSDCAQCSVISSCGGFFHSSVSSRSDHVQPFRRGL